MSRGYQLKEDCAARISERARSKFGDQYLVALSNWIKKELSRDFSEEAISSAISGRQSEFVLLDALCKYADINHREAILSPYNDSRNTSSLVSEISRLQNVRNIQALVDSICEKVEFPFEKETHSFMKQPFGDWLRNSFIMLELTEVDFLPSQYPIFEKEELLGGSNGDGFNRLGIQLLHGKKADSGKILLEKENIFVYGDPGSGKSTYLKWIALQCKERAILQEFVPLFLEMRHFPVIGTGTTLTTHFITSFEKLDVKPIELTQVLDSGRGLFILDGIDEVHRSEQGRIQNLIQKLLRDYEKCKFIFSSRLGFDLIFSTFKKVIISPFHSSKHIPRFVNQWFGETDQGKSKSNMMLEKLKSSKYLGISEISRRPVLLKLLCFIFEKHDDFPIKRADVFEQGINELVRQSYSSISIETGVRGFPELTSRDITNILCRLAKHFFIDLDGDILFNRREVERIVDNYIYEVYGSKAIDANHIISLIELYNGLLVSWGNKYCSFSHLTYQEYFVAKFLVDENQQDLIYKHLTNPSWKFIIGLVAELLPREKTAHFFSGFKYQLDVIINNNTKISNFLIDVDATSSLAIHAGQNYNSFTKVLIRAWYVVYAIGEYTSKTDGALPNKAKRHLPDMICAVSMISNDILEAHANLYNLHHCMTGEDPSKLVILINNAVKFFQTRDQRTAEILTSWGAQIHNQLERFEGSIQQWWNDKYIRKRWRERIMDLMRSLAVPCPSEFNEDEISLLKEYYITTHLFSTCLNRSEINKDKYETFSDAMLLIEHLPPDNDYNDSSTFVGF